MFQDSRKLTRQFLLGAASVATLLSVTGAGAAPTVWVEFEGAGLEAGDNAADRPVYGAQFNAGPGTTYDSIGRGDGETYRGAVQWNFGSPWSVRGGFGSGSTSDVASANGTFNYPMLATAPVSGYFFFPHYSQYYANATADIDTDVEFIDFDVGYDVGLGSGNARLFAGVRYASYDENTHAFFGNGLAFYYQSQTLDVQKTSAFSGFGPRIGIDADLPIAYGFSIGGVFAAGALFGDIDTRIARTFTSNWDGTLSSSQSISNADLTAYSLEIAPMVSFSFAGDSVQGKVSVGYRFDSYVGVVDTQTRQTALALSQFGSTSDDVQFNGAFVKVGLGF